MEPDFTLNIWHIDESISQILFEFLGLEVEGIYRVSGTKTKVDFLKESYDQGMMLLHTLTSQTKE